MLDGQHVAYMCIEDPFDPSDNVARSVTEASVRVRFNKSDIQFKFVLKAFLYVSVLVYYDALFTCFQVG